MKKVLVITQCFPCGSWLCIEKIVAEMAVKKYRIHVLGLGKPSERIKNFRYHLIPYLAYGRFGNLTCASPIIGFIWYLPLYFAALFLALVYNTKTIIYNGLTSGLILSPFFKIWGKKNIVMYHSVIGDTGVLTKFILKKLFYFVDLVVVNSPGSKEDLEQVVAPSKILINGHYADKIFFEQPPKKIKSHRTLNVLYAGRIDKDKRCFPLIDFAKKMKNNPDFSFTFVGSGADVSKVASLSDKYKNINFGGYVNEKSELAKLYHYADVVWGFADVTYLALPAIEALACGTPIIVPKLAAIANRDELVNPHLLPPSIGWFVDPLDAKNVFDVMTKIQKDKLYIGKKCRQFAVKYYSDKNLLTTVKEINKKIGAKK